MLIWPYESFDVDKKLLWIQVTAATKSEYLIIYKYQAAFAINHKSSLNKR